VRIMKLLRWIMFEVSDMPEWTRLPLRPFVWHPERIALVALAFLAGYFVLRRRCPGAVRWPLLIGALAWAEFAVCELGRLREQADIRIDLMLLYPVLVLLTLAGLLPSLVSLARGGHHA
jgi:hypothetical protein